MNLRTLHSDFYRSIVGLELAGPRRRTIFAIVIGCLGPPMFMLCILAVLAMQQGGSRVLHRQVVQSFQTRVALARVFSLTQDAETGQRGYILTADPAFLGPYNDAKAKLDSELQRLDRVSAADPDQAWDDGQLREQVRLKLQDMARSIPPPDGKIANAVALVKQGRGKVLMDAIRVTVDRMDARIDRETAAAMRSSEATGNQTTMLIAALLGAGLFFLFGAATLAVATLIKRLKSNEILAVQREETDQNTRLAFKAERRLLRQVRVSNQELKAANERLQKFTSIVAHDLRGPLRRIEAFVDVLQTDYRAALDEEGADILERIAKGSARMKLMLDSLLGYSRYNAAAIAGKTAKLTEVIVDTLTGFDFTESGIDVRIAINGVAEVKGDPILLSHVLQNLIGNAVKFRAAQDSVITIGASQNGQEISVFVIDNGIGIEPRYAEQIFEMFTRLQDEESHEGVGIGLTVCRKIVDDHGGRIWLDTAYEVGTKFVFTLRAADAIDVRMNKPQKVRAQAVRFPTPGVAVAA
jgi:signal transduction histidine kinase